MDEAVEHLDDQGAHLDLEDALLGPFGGGGCSGGGSSSISSSSSSRSCGHGIARTANSNAGCGGKSLPNPVDVRAQYRMVRRRQWLIADRIDFLRNSVDDRTEDGDDLLGVGKERGQATIAVLVAAGAFGLLLRGGWRWRRRLLVGKELIGISIGAPSGEVDAGHGGLVE